MPFRLVVEASKQLPVPTKPPGLVLLAFRKRIFLSSIPACLPPTQAACVFRSVGMRERGDFPARPVCTDTDTSRTGAENLPIYRLLTKAR